MIEQCRYVDLNHLCVVIVSDGNAETYDVDDSVRCGHDGSDPLCSSPRSRSHGSGALSVVNVASIGALSIPT